MGKLAGIMLRVSRCYQFGLAEIVEMFEVILKWQLLEVTEMIDWKMA